MSTHSSYGASTSGRPDQERAGGSGWSKAKGKARATVSDCGHEDDGDGHVHEEEPAGGMSFSIRFTDGTTEDLLDIYVAEGELVREVKRRIRLLRPTLATNRLRLIYLGRIITDGIKLVPWIAAILKRQQEQEADAQRRIAGIDFSALEGAVKSAVQSIEDATAAPGSSSSHSHLEDDDDEETVTPRTPKRKNPLLSARSRSSSFTNKGKGRADTAGKRIPDGRKIWLHCSVGEPGSIEEETKGVGGGGSSTTPSDQPQVQPLTGFDRLREAGFSDEEIANMRQQFHLDGPADTTVAGDEDEHARALEEQWMEGLGAGGADPSSQTAGMYTTLFKGVVAGFFFPFLPLFFFRVEPEVFSKRMQMAIVAGLCINVLYGALRAFA